MKNNSKIVKISLTDECKKLFKKINDDYEKRLNLNTIVSSCMEILNNINGRFDDKNVNCSKEDLLNVYDFLLLALYPIAPHICETLYAEVLKKDIAQANGLKIASLLLIFQNQII